MEMDTEKDAVAITELGVIIRRLEKIGQDASKNVGKRRPILSASEIELIKDHLDLVIKYTKL